MSTILQFPDHFLWGTATASYQVEGGVHEDCRKPSIWDVYAHTPGNIKEGDTGDVADDHYHRWREDIGLMRELGVNSYRFSIAWPRILPDGTGKINQAGIDFYSHLIDELLNSGIEPLVTLYHWDLPIALSTGWEDRSTVDAFAEFSAVAARAFGDRVKRWVTMNEPFCSAFLGYELGVHAPGLKDPSLALRVSHHLLLAHAAGVAVLHSEVPDSKVGIALNGGPFYPYTRSFQDLDAVRHGDGRVNRWFLDPLYGRHYPIDILMDYVRDGILASIEPDFIKDGDMEKIAIPTDFQALNYYQRTVKDTGNVRMKDPAYREHECTDMGWEVFPHGLYETLLRVYFTYKPQEILITENGASFSEGPENDGRVHDSRRIAFLQSHIAAMHRAIEAGVPVKGYYVWSLLDNFEWGEGYSQRFGLVHVDFQTLKRTIKDSGYWYGHVAKANQLDD